MDENLYSFDILKTKLISLGFKIENKEEYLALIVNSDLEITIEIIKNSNSHPSIIQLMITTFHSEYFNNGIITNVVGIGDNVKDKITVAVENFIKGTFNTIIESFSEKHQPEIDFTTKTYNKEILWHPNLGELTFQGEWKNLPIGEPIFNILIEGIKNKLFDQKFNWLKVYISKNSKEEIIGECIFNNELWKEGLNIIENYAKNWNENKKVELFLAQKQFIMFRRCDKFDE